MDGEQVFQGYVLTSYGDVVGVAIHRYTSTSPDGSPRFDVYYGRGDSDDELFTPDRFVQRFGLKLFSTMEDFKRGNSVDAYKVLV